jgi:hypothetical protein
LGDRRDDGGVWFLSFVCAFLHPETIGKTLADNIRRAPAGTDIPAIAVQRQLVTSTSPR